MSVRTSCLGRAVSRPRASLADMKIRHLCAADICLSHMHFGIYHLTRLQTTSVKISEIAVSFAGQSDAHTPESCAADISLSYMRIVIDHATCLRPTSDKILEMAVSFAGSCVCV